MTSFEGRIDRGSWWRGAGVVLAAALAGSLVIDPGVWTSAPSRAPSEMLALWFLVLVVPMTAVAVKRFSDRDRPWWCGYAMGGLGTFMILAEQCGFMVDAAAATSLDRVLFWLIAGVFFLAFIDNAFLRGTTGPNRYGPDPLAPENRGA